jgi:predicted metal-dependent HD superfamily phosphohydrolase
VSCLIKATIRHAIPCAESIASDLPNTVIAQFLDLDLAILASPPDIYEEYAKNVRQEYIHVPEQVYREARGKVLQAFVEREKLFFGDGKGEMEECARENIRTEIAALDATKDIVISHSVERSNSA